MIEAADVSKRGLRDAAAHRQNVAPVYYAYARVGGDPAFAGRQGDYQALLRPLFMPSFLVDDSAEQRILWRAQRDAFQCLEQDRVRTRASAGTQQGHQGDRADLGVERRASSNRGCTTNRRPMTRDVVACGYPGRVRRHGRQQRVARTCTAYRRTDEILRTYRIHRSQHVARSSRNCLVRRMVFAPDQIRSAPGVGTGAASTNDQRGVVGLSRCWITS